MSWQLKTARSSAAQLGGLTVVTACSKILILSQHRVQHIPSLWRLGRLLLLELSSTSTIVGAGLSDRGVLWIVVVVGSVVVDVVVVVAVVVVVVVMVAVGAVVGSKVSATVPSTGSRIVSVPPSSGSFSVR